MDDRAFNPHLMKTMPKPAAQPKQRAPGDDFSVRAGRENEQVYRTPAPGTSGTVLTTRSTHISLPTQCPGFVYWCTVVLHIMQQPCLGPGCMLLCDFQQGLLSLQAVARPTTASGRARPSPSSTQTS
jgi:hypothetical protein